MKKQSLKEFHFFKFKIKNDSDNLYENHVNKLKEFIEQNKANKEFFSDFEKLYSHQLQIIQFLSRV